MELRRLGLVLAATGALVWLVMLAVAPMPTSAFALKDDLLHNGARKTDGLSVAVAEGKVHAYDAANDTTWLYITTCGHSFCGPVAPLRGDYRDADLSTATLLVPEDDTLALVAAPQPDPALAEDPFVTIATQAYSSHFTVGSSWPLFLPRLVGLALAGVGLGLAARPTLLSILPGALGALVGLVVARAPMFIIFAQILVVPLAIAALIAAIVALVRGRPGWVAGGIMLFGAVELAAAFLAFAHFPPGLDA